MGSRYFASHLPSPMYRPIFGVLWDMIGDKDLRIKQEQNSRFAGSRGCASSLGSGP